MQSEVALAGISRAHLTIPYTLRLKIRTPQFAVRSSQFAPRSSHFALRNCVNPALTRFKFPRASAPEHA
ncbi:hypothetical protein N7509_004897 [Penicillium cosmopolitanum]|uniref:Uncharacterized protein n=1 Tax=Penicillium cosmopolitanum TaxID=1131564 RepID=A0A9X0B9L0_9EURO|nr:uncharacterized protein N7509_004897 [Penicillium cosmopolitanum]KAJ5396784.1 hypothetical protein N7509_004897 [Penicillium cosmopolitanum]